MVLTDDYFLATANGGVYRSEDLGQTWVRASTTPSTSAGFALVQHDGAIYHSLVPRGIYRSVDSGKTWQPTRYGVDSGGLTQCFGSWRGRFYSGGYHALREYRDSVWVNVRPDSNYAIRAFASDDRSLFKGSEQFGVMQSTDGGTTWWQPTLDFPGHEVRSILIHGDTLLAGFDSPVVLQRSTDHGRTWVNLMTGNDMPDCYALTDVNGVVFAGASVGITCSTDFGLTWEQVGTGLVEIPSMLVRSLTVHGNYLYAGTSQWIWRRPLSELLPPTTGVEEASTGVSTTSLGGAVPNPSSGTVVLPYRLGTSCSVNLSVYNAVGERVVALVDERQGAGAHSETFDVSHLPAGVYYYRLSAGGTVLSRSMIVAR